MSTGWWDTTADAVLPRLMEDWGLGFSPSYTRVGICWSPVACSPLSSGARSPALMWRGFGWPHWASVAPRAAAEPIAAASVQDQGVQQCSLISYRKASSA